VDPCLLLTSCDRKIAFLAAAKSLKKFWIGLFGRIFGAIAVERPQDLSKIGSGTVYVDKDGKLHGLLSRFKNDVHPGDLLQIADFDALIIIEVESDSCLIFKSTEASLQLPDSEKTSLPFKGLFYLANSSDTKNRSITNVFPSD
jgi:hypothetical protein